MCFDPGLVANLANFVYSTALIREKNKKKTKKSYFFVFYETQQRKSYIGQSWVHYMVEVIRYWSPSIER